MNKIEMDHQKELEKCHQQLVQNFAKFAAGQYNLSFEETVHKLIIAEEEHEKKKKKWKTFNYLQKQLLKKKKDKKPSFVFTSQSAAPGPCQPQIEVDSDYDNIEILPQQYQSAAPHESAAPSPF